MVRSKRASTQALYQQGRNSSSSHSIK